MRLKESVIIVAVAFVSASGGAYVGGKYFAIRSVGNNMEVRAERFILQDDAGNTVSSLGLVAGEPILRFIGPDGKDRVSIGVKGLEPSLELLRRDGSVAAISPNDDGPGYHLFLLKSLGKGKGVYMTTLSADELNIYQSGIGSVQLGNTGSEVGLRFYDTSSEVVDELPKQAEPP